MYYHYTNIDSLYSIIQTGKVRFGSLAFMNDENEGIDLLHVLKEVNNLDSNSEAFESIMSFVESKIDADLRFQMAFCASKLKDDVSQWRAYTYLGQGVAIEFIDGFIAAAHAAKVDCLYDFESKRKAIISNQNLALDEEKAESMVTTPDIIDKFIESLERILPQFKNASFKPENEVRWVVFKDGSDNSESKVMYRPHRLGLATYIEVDVDIHKVKSVTLGPKVPCQNKKTIEDYLASEEWSGDVAMSKCTLR